MYATLSAAAYIDIGIMAGPHRKLSGWLRRMRGRTMVLLASAPGRAEAAERAANEQLAERLLDEYGNSILRLAYSYLHNQSDAEDVLQETLMQYFKTRPALESHNHERAWLLHVAANFSKNKINYNRVREADELSEELAAQQREDLSFVWEAVKALPVIYREVMHLFYQEGYSTAQIAKILNENEATVRSRLMRGREKPKNVLKEAYDFGG